VKKLAIVVALWGLLAASPVQAKTFIGVLWPMFGPLPAPGLVELVAELKTMPDVEVRTYLHQEWPSLVDDLDRQPPGTRTLVVGYSLGANATAFVANKAKYIDAIVALQPSMLSWNPPVTGKFGRMIEIYDPNPLLTFGGMGSKKLTGANIEYITNDDSHPGAQFSSQFRNVVKGEVATLAAADRVEVAQAATPRPLALAQLDRSENLQAAAAPPTSRQRDAADTNRLGMTPTEMPQPPAPAPAPVALEQVAPESVAFLDAVTNAVNSGDLSGPRELTRAAMMDYAKRVYGGVLDVSRQAAFDSHPPAGDAVIAAAFSSSGSL
jgi:hypothetical protein